MGNKNTKKESFMILVQLYFIQLPFFIPITKNWVKE